MNISPATPHSSFWLTILLSGSVALLVLVALAVRAIPAGVWQLYALMGVTSLIVLSHVGAWWLASKRGRPDQGIALIVVAQILSAILVPLWVTDYGLLGFFLLAGIPLQVGMADDIRRMPFFLVFALLGAAGMLAADLMALPSRIALFGPQPGTYTLGGALVLGYLLLLALLFRYTRWGHLRVDLATQLALVFATISAASIIVVAGVLTSRTRTIQIQEVSRSFQTLAETNGERVGNALEKEINELIRIGQETIIMESLDEANVDYSANHQEALQQVQARQQQWETSTNKDELIRQYRTNASAAELSRFRGTNSFHGTMILTDQMGGLLALQGDQMPKPYYNDEFWWQVAWDEGRGDIYLGNLTIDPESKLASIFIAVGVTNPSTNRTLGVLASNFQLGGIQYDLGLVRTSSGGDVRLISPSGVIIAGPDRVEIGNLIWTDLHRSLELLSVAPTVQDGGELPSSTRASGWFLGPDALGQSAVFAHAPLQTSSGAKLDPIRSLGWQTVVSDTETRALADVTRSVEIASLFGLLVIAGVGIVATTAARTITRPIEALTSTATAITQGDLAQRAKPVGTVEFVTLARAFNSLTVRLRALIDDLQARVAHRTSQLQAGAEVGRAASSVLDSDELVSQIVNLITDRFGFYFAAVYLVDETGSFVRLKDASGEAGQVLKKRRHRLPLDTNTRVGQAILSRQLHTRENLDQDNIHQAGLAALLPQTRSEIILPLVTGDQVLGGLVVHSTTPGAFDESSAAVLQGMTDQLAVALQNARLYERLAVEKQRLERLYHLGQELSTRLELDQAYAAIHRVVTELMPAEGFTIGLLDESAQELEFVYMVDRDERLPHLRIPADRGMNGQVLTTGEPVFIENFEQDEKKPQAVLSDGSEPVRSALIVPLRQGMRVIGTLGVQSYQPRAYTQHDYQTLSTLASQAVIAIENARLYTHLQDAKIQLEDYNRTLEEKVAQRTLELANTRDAAQQARAEAEEASRAKSAFLANMSHELRTPLNSIINFTSFVLDEIFGPVTEEQQRYLTLVSRSSEHLLGLINDILDLAKIEAGRMELFYEQIDLGEIVDDVLATTQGLIGTKPIELRRDLPDTLPQLHVDRVRIRQVLLNLLSNAVKFTQEGSVTLGVTVSLDETPPAVTIRVQDTGIGIAPEHMDKVFAEFEQVDGELTRRVGGTGLGIPISKRFIEMHGGRIWLESELGKGSTFFFSLPLSVAPVHPPEEISGVHDTFAS